MSFMKSSLVGPFGPNQLVDLNYLVIITET